MPIPKPVKYGVQITTTATGAWSVSQLEQETENGSYKRSVKGVIFIDHSQPKAFDRLLEAIEKGLNGNITKTRNV